MPLLCLPSSWFLHLSSTTFAHLGIPIHSPCDTRPQLLLIGLLVSASRPASTNVWYTSTYFKLLVTNTHHEKMSRPYAGHGNQYFVSAEPTYPPPAHVRSNARVVQWMDVEEDDHLEPIITWENARAQWRMGNKKRVMRYCGIYLAGTFGLGAVLGLIITGVCIRLRSHV
ncbi:hypothetical protein MYU51_001579 [Penicillium brevicompactum]